MYQSWYKLETKTTVQQAHILPFDLMYLVPEKDLGLFKKVYDVFATVKPTRDVLEALLGKRLGKTSKVGITRKHTTSQVVLAGASVGDFVPKNYTEGMLLCIPILPKKRNGKLSPGYLVSHDALNIIESNHVNMKKYSWAKKSCQQELLGELELHHPGGITLPCAVCSNGIRKVMDSSYCMLGSAACLEKISLRNVESFSDKTKKNEETSEVLQ